jgi:MerR family regulatory protein
MRIMPNVVGNAYGGGQRAERALTVQVVTLVTTGQLAAELGVSRSAVLKWHRAGLIIPELITPGNHLRWDAERVREQLRARRQRDE